MNILFVCSGNTCRSPMAEVLFRHELTLAGLFPECKVSSAGLSALEGEKASEIARQLLIGEGLAGLEGHRSANINRTHVEAADLILVMAESHRRRLLSLYPRAAAKTHLLKEYAGCQNNNLDIADPYGFGREEYRRALEEIRSCVKKIISALKEE